MPLKITKITTHAIPHIYYCNSGTIFKAVPGAFAFKAKKWPGSPHQIPKLYVSASNIEACYTPSYTIFVARLLQPLMIKSCPMILPLHLLSPNDARHHRGAFDGRRHQRSEPNTHMRLQNDLLTNRYYTSSRLPSRSPTPIRKTTDDATPQHSVAYVSRSPVSRW
ncbi:hypothetical protein RchiOBHm_Chr7g0224931 [Rosa chinensis]|uniref:Uncharacterized protein n=1 Tax=Rosa chinensis TaxID=74649 RepID=A0A2P6PDY6_ROSCH|nr:hypothetical protein RchiOBHm_Chr7g0224931 [Rosa chinensis]